MKCGRIEVGTQCCVDGRWLAEINVPQFCEGISVCVEDIFFIFGDDGIICVEVSGTAVVAEDTHGG